MSLAAVAYASMTVLLVASALTLLYPAVRGLQVVVYRRAVLALGASAGLFVLGWVTTELQYHGVVDWALTYHVGLSILTVAAALHFVAVWLFARDFVQFDTGDFAIDVGTDDREGFGDE